VQNISLYKNQQQLIHLFLLFKNPFIPKWMLAKFHNTISVIRIFVGSGTIIALLTIKQNAQLGAQVILRIAMKH